jgi:hypothetical protein
MKTNHLDQGEYSVRIPERSINEITETLLEFYRGEYQKEISSNSIQVALRNWLDKKLDLVLEDLAEVLTTPHTREAAEFRHLLEVSSVKESSVEFAHLPVANEELHPMFNGDRPFSKDRLVAMMAHLSGKGLELYKTKLNKLLFYADLTNYYLTGQGISGSKYVHLPFGPVPDQFEELIDYGQTSGQIAAESLQAHDDSARLIRPGSRPASYSLSSEEVTVLDWVIGQFCELSTKEITELSHNEMAYKNTRPGEPISYRYAEFLKQTPPRDLLAKN